MDAFATLGTLLELIWIPILGVVWHHNSRLKALETKDTLTYREFVEEVKPIQEQVSAIAIKLGVEEDRRRLDGK